ncbi:MAG: sigma-70 family RNA polymerase sigma factor [Bacteroidales bacterium]|jgi:RNA polymerase sigma-70 factor (ECF subfamily)
MINSFGNIEERELIDGCVNGERNAQRRLYEKFSPRMLAVCIRYVGDRETAKDVLQDAFITLFNKIGTYKGDGSFEGWVRKIFVNTALMHIRKNDVLKFSEEIEAVNGNDLVDSNILEKLESKDIMKLISEMPYGFRTVFNLYIFEGYSHQEIAKALNISEGSSRSQLSRSRVWLRDKIKSRE